MTDVVLCRFSVLRGSEVASEGRFARSMRRAEERLREKYGTSLDGLPTEVLERFRRRFRWQSWPYNHRCGAVALVAPDESSLRCDIYLARRAFPREHHEHNWHLPRLGDELVRYAQGAPTLVMPGNNISYREVADLLLEQAQHMIRSEGCGTRSAVLLIEPELEAIDFVAQYQAVLRRGVASRASQPAQREIL